MFERYTEHARRVIFFALREAREHGSHEIDTEHLLLGLFREEQSLRRWAPKMDMETIRKRIDDVCTKGPPLGAADLPLTTAAKHVLSRAAEEADRLAHKHIGIEHLILGLLEEKNTLAFDLLHEAGADPAAIREYYGKQSQPKPWSFQRGSFYDHGFRQLSGETVEIHGTPWNVDYIRDVINLTRSYNWYWHKAAWKSRDIVVKRKDGTCSFDLSLANDEANFLLVKEGWKKDHCFVCRWEMFESMDEHGSGYTNGHDWLCTECYERFWEHPDFFSSSQSEMT